MGSWSQLKQNVPGFFGIGTALAELEKEGRLEEAAALYRDQPLFAALLENSMQSMRKCNFALTAHLEQDERFGDLWRKVREEFELTRNLILRIAGQTELMERAWPSPNPSTCARASSCRCSSSNRRPCSGWMARATRRRPQCAREAHRPDDVRHHQRRPQRRLIV